MIAYRIIKGCFVWCGRLVMFQMRKPQMNKKQKPNKAAIWASSEMPVLLFSHDTHLAFFPKEKPTQSESHSLPIRASKSRYVSIFHYAGLKGVGETLTKHFFFSWKDFGSLLASDSTFPSAKKVICGSLGVLKGRKGGEAGDIFTPANRWIVKPTHWGNRFPHRNAELNNSGCFLAWLTTCWKIGGETPLGGWGKSVDAVLKS